MTPRERAGAGKLDGRCVAKPVLATPKHWSASAPDGFVHQHVKQNTEASSHEPPLSI